MAERETRYSHLSDEEFVDELRSRLPDRSWSMAHMIELERRGLSITENDPELHEALTAAYDKLRASAAKLAKAVEEQFSATLEPLQRQLRETISSMAPKVDLKALLPNLDHLVSPEFARLPESAMPRLSGLADVVPRLEEADFGPGSIGELRGPVASSTTAERILEHRRHELEQANVAAAQLERLTEIRDEARSPRWFDWLMLAFTVIAALGAVGAVVIALI